MVIGYWPARLEAKALGTSRSDADGLLNGRAVDPMSNRIIPMLSCGHKEAQNRVALVTSPKEPSRQNGGEISPPFCRDLLLVFSVPPCLRGDLFLFFLRERRSRGKMGGRIRAKRMTPLYRQRPSLNHFGLARESVRQAITQMISSGGSRVSLHEVKGNQVHRKRDQAKALGSPEQRRVLEKSAEQCTHEV